MGMIDCADITKTYFNADFETVVLKGVTFSISAGAFVAIMGPSGSGKSTLMNILGCLDTPTSGTYLIDGSDAAQMDSDELADMRNKKIGFVFQSFNLLPRISVLRNVALPLIYANVGPDEREERAIRALNAAAFPEQFWNHHPNQLSGGMMQRVAIARALVNDPVILLADEPTGNLDSNTGEMVLETFQNLNRDHGRTIILITHERYVAEHARRIISVRDGLIVQDGAVQKQRIVNNHHHSTL